MTKLEVKLARRDGQIAALQEIEKAYHKLSGEDRWIGKRRIPVEAIRLELPLLSDLKLARPQAVRRGEKSQVVPPRSIEFARGWEEITKEILGEVVE